MPSPQMKWLSPLRSTGHLEVVAVGEAIARGALVGRAGAEIGESDLRAPGRAAVRASGGTRCSRPWCCRCDRPGTRGGSRSRSGPAASAGKLPLKLASVDETSCARAPRRAVRRRAHVDALRSARRVVGAVGDHDRAADVDGERRRRSRGSRRCSPPPTRSPAARARCRSGSWSTTRRRWSSAGCSGCASPV